MNSILKVLFHGKMSPVNWQMVRGADIAHIVNELADDKNLLEHALTPELLLLQGEVPIWVERAAFKNTQPHSRSVSR